jgi:hypothetical protein
MYLKHTNQFMLLWGNNLLGRKKASLRMLHELNFTGWLIKISFSPSMAAAWVAADEEQRHPFFPPRGGLQNSRIKVQKLCS